MSDLNSVNLSGRIVYEPELKFLPNGTPKAVLRLVSSRTYTSNGEKREDAVFIDVETWSKLAENCCKFLGKGSRVIVEGMLQLDEWESDGQKRSKIYVRADQVHFVETKKASGESEDRGAQSSAQGRGSYATPRRETPRRDRETQSERAAEQAPSQTPALDGMDESQLPF